MNRILSIVLLLGASISLHAQVDSLATDTLVEEEDFSMYDNLDFADPGVKRFCTSKVLDLSPAKFITIGYDYQARHQLNNGAYKASILNTTINYGEQSTAIKSSGGPRFSANIPVISRNNIIIQLGANYLQNDYALVNKVDRDPTQDPILFPPMQETIEQSTLRSMGLSATVFKPLNERQFLIFQASQDWNGDYNFGDFQDMHMPTFSAAGIFGWKPSDRKMIGFGATRNYRAGELNYIPVFLLNWTAPSRKWGVEILAPARGHYRRTFSSRSLLLIGYELEGNSYVLSKPSVFQQSESTFVLRRSELRFRAVYERSIKSFIWLSWQVGYRYNYSYNVDELADGQDFFRGFFGDQPYAIENDLTNSFYTMFTINLVSP